jgi:hypothetical protein
MGTLGFFAHCCEGGRCFEGLIEKNYLNVYRWLYN